MPDQGLVKPYPIDFRGALRRCLPADYPGLSDDCLSKMEEHARLLLHWNDRFHLTSVTDPLEIVRRHFAESLLASSWLGSGGLLLDLGSGGGFPGLPLHMARGDGSLILLDSSEKKSLFLETVVSRCGLKSARVITRRARRAADLLDLAPMDAICMRAVKDPDMRVSWLSILLKPGGRGIFFLGEDGRGRVEQEAREGGIETVASIRIPPTSASWLVVLEVPR